MNVIPDELVQVGGRCSAGTAAAGPRDCASPGPVATSERTKAKARGLRPSARGLTTKCKLKCVILCNCIAAAQLVWPPLTTPVSALPGTKPRAPTKLSTVNPARSGNAGFALAIGRSSSSSCCSCSSGRHSARPIPKPRSREPRARAALTWRGNCPLPRDLRRSCTSQQTNRSFWGRRIGAAAFAVSAEEARLRALSRGEEFT